MALNRTYVCKNVFPPKDGLVKSGNIRGGGDSRGTSVVAVLGVAAAAASSVNYNSFYTWINIWVCAFWDFLGGLA